MNNMLYSVHFVDTQNGWVVGGKGIILHTANGGKTWIEQKSDTEEWLHFNEQSSLYF